MNNQKYSDLKISIVKIFKSNTEIAKGIKNLAEYLAEDFQSTVQDVLFVTMKEFTNEYRSSSTLQYYHYLGNIERDELANMLNFLDLTRQGA